MPKHYGSYPIKATSRAVTRKRTRRLTWFIVGTAFGIGCASSLTPIFLHTPVQVAAPAIPQTTPVVAVATSAPLVVAESEDTAPAPIALANTSEEAVPPQIEVIAAEPSSPPVQYPLALDLKVGNGDTLTNMLADAGVTADEAYAVLTAIKKVYDPKKLGAGKSLSVELDKRPDNEHPYIKNLTVPVSLTASLEINRKSDGVFDAKKIDKPLERKLAHAGGKISSSLYETGAQIGLPASMVGEIINAYSYDVDFQRDIQPGHAIDVLYERLETQDGKKAGTGNLIFAELNLGAETLKLYRYVDSGGNADFYNETGESVRKALLRTPINGARISSGYGMRNHPIMGYSRMHRGVDFAAPTGTPIFAAGDGKVEFVGRKNGYGNYLKLQHNDKYASAYAHISRFASGMAPGRKVKQGQIVAYVGSTGNSTGPHLHYEIMVNGDQVNPSGVKFKTGNVLKGRELAAFRKSMEKIEAKLEAVKNGKDDIAMADFEREVYSN